MAALVGGCCWVSSSEASVAWANWLALGGLAGGLFAGGFAYVSPDQFSFAESVVFLLSDRASVITGQMPAAIDTTPIGGPNTVLGNANGLAQWSYCFDRGDTDTSRGNIITPLKDRISSQILTHYPKDAATAVTIRTTWAGGMPSG